MFQRNPSKRLWCCFIASVASVVIQIVCKWPWHPCYPWLLALRSCIWLLFLPHLLEKQRFGIFYYGLFMKQSDPGHS
ncbi:hypothetical protein M441DRAFT_299566 [Trichoderma asperellum CBS 433.97]|uniref:Uncharacterized protein n=1 Tax=Trichoderma asperellum (strain ATCC 204424 / CBS 433.97 / NBRC 101777) TaxID=1042311 RepID=A0A2T3ZJ39_TRIA4|nr:hypothetical protein M441DRAFT_299566 [Trichoderma asperellum CBS 433.97]PTB44827.1 hypothetical protein M441DRAFT_299566 [Trichoderma asperellum CBS 433.97]